MKKAVMDVKDFDKLATYITRQPVAFNKAHEAVEVQEVLKNVLIMEVEFKDTRPQSPYEGKTGA
jgi:hypothetical protein